MRSFVVYVAVIILGAAFLALILVASSRSSVALPGTEPTPTPTGTATITGAAIPTLPDGTQPTASGAAIPDSWKSFSDVQAGIAFRYPDTWTVRTEGGSFPDGDLLSLLVRGGTQRTQTELYDGIIFSVMKPVATAQETLAWMKERYEASPPVNPDQPSQYDEVTVGGVRYNKIITCGLGCFTYYHTKQNGKIYGFLIFAEGPNKAAYETAAGQIMATVRFLQ